MLDTGNSIDISVITYCNITHWSLQKALSRKHYNEDSLVNVQINTIGRNYQSAIVHHALKSLHPSKLSRWHISQKDLSCNSLFSYVFTLNVYKSVIPWSLPYHNISTTQSQQERTGKKKRGEKKILLIKWRGNSFKAKSFHSGIKELKKPSLMNKIRPGWYKLYCDTSRKFQT